MEKRVTVLMPNGRRQNVSVSANMTLLEILETSCKKHGFDSEEHCLKFHNKPVSLTQQFRFSGLPNNCVLEMEPTERRRPATNVVVCIQLVDGSREQGEFAPSATVWEVVQQLHSSNVRNYDSPVIIYMRSEVIGKNNMEQTTLKSLGILEGRAMMRLIDKKPEDLKKQANVYKPHETKAKSRDEDDQPSTSRSAMGSNGGASSGGGGGFALTSNMLKSLKRKDPEDSKEDEKSSSNQPEAKAVVTEPEPRKYDWGSGSGYLMQHQSNQMQLDDPDESPEEVPPVVNVIGPRHAILFSLDDTKKPENELPDSFFDLTVHDLKMVLRDLKRTSTGDEDAPLLTAKLRELERQKTMLSKLNQYKDCVLRIQFPDRYVLQGIFKPHESLAKVEEFVREFLANTTEEFHLFTIPPKKILPSNETLLELNLVPNAVVHFGYLTDSLNAENHRFVQEKFIKELTSEEGAHYAVQKYRLTRGVTVGAS
ncbi:uncharacterized protein Dwil_GK13175 [Drosophila willistoni]|uniref:UBX domain-containing protein n=2 Tax=Drosophila willistoni TaxID=7260 RepID=B4NGN6_DROWI|nr:tether containing UBX domain for GLUT4 isoform X1 [Drosophila willistoni]XP_023035741.1 tether containing UBX domain for GLUT4 isoform X2 [Drosophila willistoni]EDW84383.1 uncharacterized protein Dwil_GK13175 [Drosophila willistoni]